MSGYFPVRCPECGWRGSSKDSVCFCYGDDYSDCYCPGCWNPEDGKQVVLIDDDEEAKPDE